MHFGICGLFSAEKRSGSKTSGFDHQHAVYFLPQSGRHVRVVERPGDRVGGGFVPGPQRVKLCVDLNSLAVTARCQPHRHR